MAKAVSITSPRDHKVSPFFAAKLAEWREIHSTITALMEEEVGIPPDDTKSKEELWSSIDALVEMSVEIRNEVFATEPNNAAEFVIKSDLLQTSGIVAWEFHEKLKAEAAGLVAKMFPL